MQSLSDAVTGMICSIGSLFVMPTILLLLLRQMMPALGNPLWRGYCQLLTWLVVLPVRLVRLLITEATGRGRRR